MPSLQRRSFPKIFSVGKSSHHNGCAWPRPPLGIYHLSPPELTLQAHLALRRFTCCCCGYVSLLLQANKNFPSQNCQCPACTHIPCGSCILGRDTGSALTPIHPCADYHQIPASCSDGDMCFGYICKACGYIVAVQKQKNPPPSHKARLLAFKRQACERCGQEYGSDRLKFKVAKGTNVGDLASPDVTAGQAVPKIKEEAREAPTQPMSCIYEQQGIGDISEELILSPA